CLLKIAMGSCQLTLGVGCFAQRQERATLAEDWVNCESLSSAHGTISAQGPSQDILRFSKAAFDRIEQSGGYQELCVLLWLTDVLVHESLCLLNCMLSENTLSLLDGHHP